MRDSGSAIPECTVLISLVSRLEAATSRLEDIAQATIDPSAATNGSLAAPAAGAPPIGQRAQSAPIPSIQAPPPPEPLPQAIKSFDRVIDGEVQKYVSLSEGLGGLLAEQAHLQKQMGIVNDIREANRGSPLFNHLSTVSEGISALAWVTYEPKPATYLTEILEGAQFYGNRVLKEYKEKYVHSY
ncbi:hypothetical protein GP486_002454 [Trichoglossum hirsutum]|uniref:CAP N-terminal domain-containing protein n=1 Tax=Trichoglossum hirsutum TaxID=265104 RepID=A0A9P8LEY9_9PEZI|nr:hypothetical protein GP486_002454 [Trichoglossum hirsutum]